MSNESVKANLIQAWKLSYVDDQGMRITAKPEAPVITYEFYANNTLAFYDGKKPSEKAMGNLNATSYSISFTMKGSNSIYPV